MASEPFGHAPLWVEQMQEPPTPGALGLGHCPAGLRYQGLGTLTSWVDVDLWVDTQLWEPLSLWGHQRYSLTPEVPPLPLVTPGPRRPACRELPLAARRASSPAPLRGRGLVRGPPADPRPHLTRTRPCNPQKGFPSGLCIPP